MATFGSEDAGFSLDTDGDRLVVRGWGFWDADVAEAFGPAVREVCSAQIATRVDMDMRDLRPMREEGQLAFGTLIEGLREYGIQGVVVTTSSQLTKLQLARLVRAHEDFVHFEDLEQPK